MSKIVTIISFLIISIIVPAQEFIFKSYVDQNSITDTALQAGNTVYQAGNNKKFVNLELTKTT